MHDNKNTIRRLNIIKGQVEGIIKMVEEDRYCIDISNQLMAVSSALKSLNTQVLSNHIRTCVNDSFKDNRGSEEKIEEIISVINKLNK